jgi:hypothetical protein
MTHSKLLLLADDQSENISGGCWAGEDNFDLSDADMFADSFTSELFFSTDSFEQRSVLISGNSYSQLYISRVSINI